MKKLRSIFASILGLFSGGRCPDQFSAPRFPAIHASDAPFSSPRRRTGSTRCRTPGAFGRSGRGWERIDARRTTPL